MNKKDNKCFQCIAPVALNHMKNSNKGKIKSRARSNSKASKIRFKSFYWSKLLCQ